MSFFDEDDEPTRRTPRPRRPRPAGPAAADSQQIWIRRGIALGLGLLILFLLVIAVNACQDNARKNALTDYNREVSALVQQSDSEVGDGFFELLGAGAAESPEDLQTGISSYKEQSETLIDQAERVSAPDQMVAAHRSLLTAFELRRDGLQYVAERISAATGDQGDAADEAIEQIAGQMQAFLASDVLIQARVTPFVKEALDEAEIGGQTVVATTGFLPDVGWLEPSAVATALDTQISGGGGGGGRDADEPPAPGLHGHGLVSVGVGDITLEPSAPNRVPAGDDVTFSVRFANQGENDEFDVQVVVTLEGPGRPIRARRTIDTVAQGAEATANLALPQAPTAGEVYTVEVEVRPVPGEEKTDNNSQTYQVLFTQA